MGFPSLINNPARYSDDSVNCSICGKIISYDQTNQLWISLWIGTDVIPLLANLCSKDCENKLPNPSENYVQYAHKGGTELVQPPDQNELLELEMKKFKKEENKKKTKTKQTDSLDTSLEKATDKKMFQILKLIRKIWER